MRKREEVICYIHNVTYDKNFSDCNQCMKLEEAGYCRGCSFKCHQSDCECTCGHGAKK